MGRCRPKLCVSHPQNIVWPLTRHGNCAISNRLTKFQPNQGGLCCAHVRVQRKTWFVCDLVSVFPFTYLLQPWETERGNGNTRFLRFLRMPRLIKLLRLAKIKRLLMRYAEVEPKIRLVVEKLDMINLVAGILLIAHLMACFWNFVGDYGTDCADQLDDKQCVSWQTNQFAEIVEDEQLSCRVEHGECAPFECFQVDVAYVKLPVNSTAPPRYFQCRKVFDRYMHALYWSITTLTTVGYGDISATSVLEMVYSVVRSFAAIRHARTRPWLG